MSKNIYYITEILDLEHRGWLEAKIDGYFDRKLPYSTKVELLEETPNHQKVKILEGYFKNHLAFLPFMLRKGKNNYQYLTNKFKFGKNLSIKIEDDKLSFGQYRMDIIFDPNFFKKGIYKINFPIITSKKVEDYLLESKGGSRFASTWFPIMGKNDLFTEKYLHFGLYSKGCITVKYKPNKIPSPWQQLFISLMTSRKSINSLGSLYIE